MELIQNVHSKPKSKRNTYARSYRIANKYGLLPEEYDELYEHQRGRCAICGILEESLNHSFHVDHNHKTGRVRGLLCVNCNHILGKAKESPTILMKAVAYLKENINEI